MDEPPAGDGAVVGGAMVGGAVVGAGTAAEVADVVPSDRATLVLPGLAALVAPAEWITVRCGSVVEFVGSTDDRAALVLPALDVLAPELLAPAFVALEITEPDPAVDVVTAGTAAA